MADDVDNANEIQELFLERALASRKPAPQTLATGFCQNPLCGEYLGDPRLYCDGKCAGEAAKYGKK